MFARVLLVSSLAMTVLAGCSSSSKTVSDTTKYWSSDVYVTDVDGPSRSGNAARIIDRAPLPTNVTMQISSLRLPVHADPDVQSPVVGTLDQGDAVTVLEWSRFYRIPGTSLMNEHGDDEFAPTWARVENSNVSGYVGARSLVDPEILMTTDEAAARARADQSGEDAGKGFTKGSKKKRVAAKGLAGAPQLDGADYEAIEALLAGADHPATGYRQSDMVILDTDPYGMNEDVLELASVDLEDHDPALAAALIAAAKPAEDGEDEGVISGATNMLGGMFNVQLSDEAKMLAAVADIVLELLSLPGDPRRVPPRPRSRRLHPRRPASPPTTPGASWWMRSATSSHDTRRCPTRSRATSSRSRTMTTPSTRWRRPEGWSS